jgi:hypothetical protein
LYNIHYNGSLKPEIIYLFANLDDDHELSITVDNQMELYIDGEPNPINQDPSAKDWRVVKTVKLPRGSRVIAVKATDVGLWAGLLASVTGEKLLSDRSWKVSTVESADWMKPEFDDSQWETATELGPNGMNPWKAKEKISNNAKWIWTTTSYYKDMNAHVVYFRVRLGSYIYLSMLNNCLFS